MRILHFITGLGRGGAEQMLYKLISGTKRNNVESAVLSMLPGGVYADRLAALGVPVENLGIRRGFPVPKGFCKLHGLVRRYQPSLIQCWMYHPNAMASAAQRLGLLQTPTVWNVRHSVNDVSDEGWSMRLGIQLGTLLAAQPAKILFNSRTSIEQHHALGYPIEKCEVIPNGFDCTEFYPDPAARARIRQALGIGADHIVVLHVARFHPMKDHAGFLRTAKSLLEDPRYIFVFAGTGVTWDNAFFANRISGLDRSRFRLLGEQDKLPGLFNAGDLVCLSSSYGEGFPNVLGEAMATGTPCIATDVGDSAHVVGDTGIIVSPRSPADLADAIRTLTDEPLPRQRARREACRARIERKFSLPTVIDTYYDLYDRVLGAAHGGDNQAAHAHSNG